MLLLLLLANCVISLCDEVVDNPPTTGVQLAVEVFFLLWSQLDGESPLSSLEITFLYIDEARTVSLTLWWRARQLSHFNKGPAKLSSCD